MDTKTEEELESSFLTTYALIHSVLFSGYIRKQAQYTKTQICILAALHLRRELCMSQLAELISAANAQATRAVFPLIRDGLVARCADSINRKRVYIRLTEEGSAFIHEYLRSRLVFLNRSLSEEEAERLTEAVRTMAEIYNSAAGRRAALPHG